jgi:predicted DsbA family dithiol-disulfide isomerase
MIQMQHALKRLEGDVVTEIRWHPFRLGIQATPRVSEPRTIAPTPSPAARQAHAIRFRDYLAGRLPTGVPIELAEQSLAGAARELGVEFHFERMGTLPDTSEAHRLTMLAAREGLQARTAAAIFRAYFADLRDIGDRAVLAAIASDVGLSAQLVAEFESTREGEDALAESERRLRGFGVQVVPNLLFNGRVLVPGAVNVDTYVHALDQALFPEVDADSPPRLH